MGKFVFSLAAVATLSLLHAGPAQALPLETWVSSTGSGSTCSRAAPCATFQIAHDNTAAGGQISVVDSGEYGPVLISKSISIVAEGSHANILAAASAGSSAIFVSIAATDIVVLRGLILDGIAATNGGQGISFINSGSLHVENCVIKNFTNPSSGFGSAINFVAGLGTTSPSELYVSDTTLIDNGGNGDGAGILILPRSSGPVRAVIDRVASNNNFRGIKVDGSLGQGSVVNVNVRDSVFSGSVNNGIVATTPQGGALLLLTLDRITSSNNGPSAPTSVGVVSDGPSSFIRITNSTVTGNWKGLSFSNGAQLISFGNNMIIGNSTDGSPSSVATSK